ncbi:hypothetical protein [Rhodoferax antarcticus]|nr:hypothetical protein [Rhodoferax antarcticus]
MKKKDTTSVPLRHKTRGRPTPYQFQGLFLPSIQWEMKTEGVPWHEMENEPNELGSLFRNLRRQDVDPTSSLTNLLPIIQAKMQPNSAAEFKSAVQAVRDGAFTDDLLMQMPGNWACFRMGADKLQSPYFDEYVTIETEVKAADVALDEGNYQRAAELVQSNANLRQYWSDENLRNLASATTPNATLSPRLQAWLQLQVSVLAKWAMRESVALQAQQNCGSLEHLLNALRDDGSAAPGAMWLRAMVRLTKAHSIAEALRLVRNETLVEDLPSEATIKRWSRGSLFPVASEKLEKFIRRVSLRAGIADPNLNHAEVFESAQRYYWAARRFDSILWFVSLAHSGTKAPKTESSDCVHAPSAWLRAEFKRLQGYHS